MRWLDGVTDLNGCECEQAPGDGEGQGSLTCCSPWGCKQTQLKRLSLLAVILEAGSQTVCSVSVSFCFCLVLVLQISLQSSCCKLSQFSSNLLSVEMDKNT